jgi:hypothetical protein
LTAAVSDLIVPNVYRLSSVRRPPRQPGIGGFSMIRANAFTAIMVTLSFAFVAAVILGII